MVSGKTVNQFKLKPPGLPGPTDTTRAQLDDTDDRQMRLDGSGNMTLSHVVERSEATSRLTLVLATGWARSCRYGFVTGPEIANSSMTSDTVEAVQVSGTVRAEKKLVIVTIFVSGIRKA
jgi:hypothetical protein